MFDRIAESRQRTGRIGVWSPFQTKDREKERSDMGWTVLDILGFVINLIYLYLLVKWQRSAARHRKEISDPAALEWAKKSCNHLHSG